MAVTINGSAGVTTNSGAVYNGISAGTAVASTSGTSIDFTSIPSWVKRITVMFNGVSTNAAGSSLVQVQIGAGSITSSGYLSYTGLAGATNATSQGTSTTGFAIDAGSPNTSWVRYGTLMLTNITGNTWIASVCLGLYNGTNYYAVGGGGSIALSGTLDRVRITTVNGTDTFDAGTINILYE